MIQAQQENPEMQHIRLQIERQERQLKELERKRDFEKTEHNSRITQKERVIQGRLAKLAGEQQKQLFSFHETAPKSREEAKRVEMKLAQLAQEEERYQQEFNRLQAAAAKKPDHKPREDIMQTSKMRELQAERSRLQRELADKKRLVQAQETKDERDKAALARRIEVSIEREKQTLEREYAALKDSGARMVRGYEDRIQRLQYTITSLKDSYEREKREFELAEKNRLKKESEDRARFGNAGAQKNFAAARPDGPINPNQGHEDTSRRRSGGARW